jgi:hypothetical protein
MEGFLIQFVIFVIVPIIIATGIGVVAWVLSRDGDVGFGTFLITLFLAFMIMIPVGSVYWYNAYEVPSVQEKIITVGEWQPKAGLQPNSEGIMTINNADDLMLITTEKEGFFNEENFLFGKFNTRDIFNTLKVNGTYKIKYYGWREGFNSGFPNILSVEEIVDEKNATVNRYGDYFGTKLA